MKKQLLDPIGTMCKLVGLNFTKVNTKIKIHNHILNLDKPDNFQFFMRWCDGDGKDNISELYHVITRIIKWYIVEVKKSSSSTSEIIPYTSTSTSTSTSSSSNTKSLELAKCPEFIKMINYLCDAFSKLENTYKFGNVVLAIRFYINILQDAIHGKFNDDHLPKCVLETDGEYTNLLDYDKIKNLWDTTKIKRVCDLYDSCFEVEKNQDGNDDEIKDALIEGYLRSIDAILTVTDKEFQKLIHNSNKG
jgi:hypothetical protein